MIETMMYLFKGMCALLVQLSQLSVKVSMEFLYVSVMLLPTHEKLLSLMSSPSCGLDRRDRNPSLPNGPNHRDVIGSTHVL